MVSLFQPQGGPRKDPEPFALKVGTVPLLQRSSNPDCKVLEKNRARLPPQASPPLSPHRVSPRGGGWPDGTPEPWGRKGKSHTQPSALLSLGTRTTSLPCRWLPQAVHVTGLSPSSSLWHQEPEGAGDTPPWALHLPWGGSCDSEAGWVQTTVDAPLSLAEKE